MNISSIKTPIKCPLCDGPLTYTYGEMMFDDIYHCLSEKHSNYQFSAETSNGYETSKYIQIYVRDIKIACRWTYEKWGDIPANTLTVGSFDPYQNKRLPWFEPDYSNIDNLIRILVLSSK